MTGKRKGRDVTMRRMILAGVCAMALLATGEARAQMAVIDGANLLNTAKQVQQGLQQIQQLTNQLTTMQQQLNQMTQTYQAIAHAPSNDLQQLAGQLNIPSLRNVLPTNSGTFGTVMNGTGLSGAGNLGQQYLNQNKVYTPSGSDFSAQQMQTNAASIAGTQAMTAQMYQSASDHIATLQGLEGQLASANDAKSVADINARVSTEQTYIAAQQVQMQALQTAQAAQVRNADEQEQEKRRSDIDDVINAAKSNAGS